MSKKVRFTIYGITIVGILTWWWMIPSAPSYKPRAFRTKQSKVLLSDKVIMISNEEMDEKLKELIEISKDH